MPTAMEQIKRELGADAIIVKSRKVKQKYGPLGLFRRSVYEVVVSYDPAGEPPYRDFQSHLARRTDPSGKRNEVETKAQRRKPASIPTQEEPVEVKPENFPRLVDVYKRQVFIHLERKRWEYLFGFLRDTGC